MHAREGKLNPSSNAGSLYHVTLQAFVLAYLSPSAPALDVDAIPRLSPWPNSTRRVLSFLPHPIPTHNACAYSIRHAEPSPASHHVT